MIKIDIKEENMKQVEELVKSSPKLVTKCAVSAINRTITTVKTEISKSVRERYTVKAKEVKRAFTVKRASSSLPKAEVIAKGSPLGLPSFSIRRRKRGPVRVQVLRGGKAKPVSGLFFNKFKSGYTGPMHRRQPARYPLASPFGPSVPGMVGNEETLEPAAQRAEEVLNERFLHEIERRFPK